MLPANFYVVTLWLAKSRERTTLVSFVTSHVITLMHLATIKLDANDLNQLAVTASGSV